MRTRLTFLLVAAVFFACAAQTSNDKDDPVAPELFAKSFRGQRAPRFYAEKWLSPTPDTSGKFVLIDFWATWCGPCKKSIPQLNGFQAKFRDRLVVIGLTDESESEVRAMKEPKIAYYLATDSQKRMSKAVGVTGIPHTLLLDPKGIVRFEGMPGYLTEKSLERLLEKYSK